MGENKVTTDPNWKDFNYYFNLDTKIQDNYISNIKMQRIEQQQKVQELELKQLFEFLENWKSKYDVFCHEFSCYSYYANQDMIWDRAYDREPFKYLETSKREVYIDDFFNMVLGRSAKFELHSYQNPHMSHNRQSMYGYSKEQATVVKTDKFMLTGKDSGYRLDIRMHPALVVSLIATMYDNYTVFDLMRNKRFREFVGNLCSAYCVEFSLKYNTIHVPYTFVVEKLNSRIFQCNGVAFRTENELFIIDSTGDKTTFKYPHLDEIFGNNRTKALTREDIQLYSIVNEGRKPIMYDFEF